MTTKYQQLKDAIARAFAASSNSTRTTKREEVTTKYQQLKDAIDRGVRDIMAKNSLLGYQTAFALFTQQQQQLMSAFRDAVYVEISDRVAQFRKNFPATDYEAALKGVMRADSMLYRDWDFALRGFTPAPQADPEKAAVEEEIAKLVKENLTASDGNGDYANALMGVLSRNPDLRRRYQETKRVKAR